MTMIDDRTICVDFDDVLCETAAGLLEVVECEFGISKRFEEIHSFDLAESFGLSDAEVTRLFHILHRADTLRGLRPIEGAVETIREWIVDDLQVAVVTGRPPTTREASRDWLDRRGLESLDLLFVDKYSRYHAEEDASSFLTLEGLAALRCRLFVDDSPDVVAYLAREGRSPIAIFDRPWNTGRGLEGEQEDGKVTRCRGWAEIREKFRFGRG
ncbi:MAG: hypothetical protein HQ559_04530 [Lentisphaerae bacterium]|nr:hypothetical protein [Lentisphaerota bacterium]